MDKTHINDGYKWLRAGHTPDNVQRVQLAVEKDRRLSVY